MHYITEGKSQNSLNSCLEVFVTTIFINQVYFWLLHFSYFIKSHAQWQDSFKIQNLPLLYILSKIRICKTEVSLLEIHGSCNGFLHLKCKPLEFNMVKEISEDMTGVLGFKNIMNPRRIKGNAGRGKLNLLHPRCFPGLAIMDQNKLGQDHNETQVPFVPFSPAYKTRRRSHIPSVRVSEYWYGFWWSCIYTNEKNVH